MGPKKGEEMKNQIVHLMGFVSKIVITAESWLKTMHCMMQSHSFRLNRFISARISFFFSSTISVMKDTGQDTLTEVLFGNNQLRMRLPNRTNVCIEFNQIQSQDILATISLPTPSSKRARPPFQSYRQRFVWFTTFPLNSHFFQRNTCNSKTSECVWKIFHHFYFSYAIFRLILPILSKLEIIWITKR